MLFPLCTTRPVTLTSPAGVPCSPAAGSRFFSASSWWMAVGAVPARSLVRLIAPRASARASSATKRAGSIAGRRGGTAIARMSGDVHFYHPVEFGGQGRGA